VTGKLHSHSRSTYYTTEQLFPDVDHVKYTTALVLNSTCSSTNMPQ